MIVKEKIKGYLTGALVGLAFVGSFAWAGAAFSRVTTWSNGQVLTASALNAEFDNILNNLDPDGIDDFSADTTEMRSVADPYPVAVESLAITLEGELERLRYQILEIKKAMQASNVTYWYQDLPTAGVFTVAGSSVGVNDTTPAASLDVTGSLNATSTVTFSGMSLAIATDVTMAIPYNTSTVLVFDTEVVDTTSEFNGSTFTATSTGYYQACFFTQLATGETFSLAAASIVKNGTTSVAGELFDEDSTEVFERANFSMCGAVNLSAGDTLTATVSVLDTAADGANVTLSRFSVQRLPY